MGMAFSNLSPIAQAFIATIFTWGMTALGASLVFTTKEINKKLMDFMLGSAAGVMIAASFWSLLSPALVLAKEFYLPAWLTVSIGFLVGGLVLRLIDKILPHLHYGFAKTEVEGIKTNWHKSTLFILAIVLHHIPEGLALGVAFGAVASKLPEASLAAAIALTIGMGIQNFPEGTAVAIPLRRDGMSRAKSFFLGQMSAAVEPVAAVIGAMAVAFAKPLLPFALAFAAGAMIFVVVEEVIPESQSGGNPHLATLGAMVGFVVMMSLDTIFA
jgi:ZIP family zinc transporter